MKRRVNSKETTLDEQFYPRFGRCRYRHQGRCQGRGRGRIGGNRAGTVASGYFICPDCGEKIAHHAGVPG